MIGRSATYGRSPRPGVRWGRLRRAWRVLSTGTVRLLPLARYPVVGAVLGLLIGLLLGSAGWFGALIGAAVALGTGSTRLTERGWRPPTWSQLLDAWDPAGAVPRWLRAQERVYRSPPPVFGLPDSWTVARYITGVEEVSLGATRFVAKGVGHAAPSAPEDVEGSYVEVVSLIPERGIVLPEEESDRIRSLLLRELAQRIWQEAHPPPRDRSPRDVRGWAEARDRARQAWHFPEPTPIEIPVDGEPVAFGLLGEGAVWGALGRIGSVVIRLRARDWDVGTVELRRVEDMKPYFEGTRRRFRLEAG